MVIKGVQKLIERLYVGVCDVIVYQEITDPVTKRTSFAEVTDIVGQPCRLSYNSSNHTGDGNLASKNQVISLFLPPSINIKSGSKIVVTQHGKVQTFTNSSEPKLYASHQEIELKDFEGWA